MTLTHKDIWDRKGTDLSTDAYTKQIVQHEFLSKQHGEAITAQKSIILKDTTHLDVADSICEFIKSKLNTPFITGENDNSYILSGKLVDDDVLVFVEQGSHSRNAGSIPSDYEDENTKLGLKVSRIKIEVTGHRRAIKAIFSHISNTFKEAKVSAVKWWFKADHGVQSSEIFLEPITSILRQEFYPYLQDTPTTYLKKYIESPQPVLLLAGPTGTGKTTLLRHLLLDNNLSAEVIYDESLMNNDSIFQNFLFGNSDILIIEDADRILQPRESGENSLMARFLSVSEGIIKLPNKKMIFTTNISDYGRVDTSLIRPGRCYDVIHTRELNYKEACTAAEVAELEIPKEVREYTLAELFFPNSGGKFRKMGIV